LGVAFEGEGERSQSTKKKEKGWAANNLASGSDEREMKEKAS